MAEDEKQELPPTDMLYMTYDGNWEMECDAKVLNVSKQPTNAKTTGENALSVVLDQTVMHAQGGGQPTDIGKIVVVDSSSSVDDEPPQAMDVSKVLIDRSTGVARHTVTVPDAAASEAGIKVGDSVKVSVNEENRLILSECHTAGHVVDSAMARCGKMMKPSKAYHFLQGPYVEYEGSIPPEERDSVLADLQTAFCQLVNENIDTEIALLSKSEADAVCNRQAQNFDMDIFANPRNDQIRVVTVAGYPCPCGGTHVRSTGDLAANQWGITGIKSKKGVVRVKYGQGTNKAKTTK